MKLIDLSVTLVSGLPVDPAGQIPHIEYFSHICERSIQGFLSYFPGLTEKDLFDGEAWATENLQIHSHAGTHMDAPWHFHSTMNGGESAWCIDEVPLEWCIGPGVVVDASNKPDGYIMTSADFIEYFQKFNYTLKPGDIVLLHTAAPKVWGTPKYLTTGCGVGREGTLWLCEQGVRTMGTDAWSWDAPFYHTAKRFAEEGDSSIIWEGHKAGRDKTYLHIEKLTNLNKLPIHGFTFIGFPIKIDRASAGWVRAVAMLNDN